MDDLLTSAEAARLAGVGTTAIKRWSDSGALRCVKTAGGHRRFHRVDIERLMRADASAGPGEDWSGWIDALRQNLGGHTVQARLLDERARLGSWHAVADAMGRLLTEIGRRWEVGEIAVIEEHLMSATLQRALAAIVEALPVPTHAPVSLLAVVPGDEHTLGLSLIELALREAGWRAEWAGSHTRTGDVVGRVAAGGLGMVALSASLASSDAAAEIGEACRSAGVPLALGGGGAWPDAPAWGRRFTAIPAFVDYAAAARRG